MNQLNLEAFRKKWAQPGQTARCALCEEPIDAQAAATVRLETRIKGANAELLFHAGCFEQLEMRKSCGLGESVHDPACKLRLAAFGPPHDPCPHGYFICPLCHPCTCVCARCGCTATAACVKDGVPCHWAAPTLCSACAT